MDTGSEAQYSSKHSELSTLKTSLETVIAAHYPALAGHVALRLVACPGVCAEALNLLARYAQASVGSSSFACKATT